MKEQVKEQVLDILKKFWFVILVGCLFIGVAIYFAWDTNKDKIPGKSVDGKDVIFSLDDTNYTADEYYDALFDYEASGTKSGIAVLYNLLQKEVMDQCVETTSEMEDAAEESVEFYETTYKQQYGDNYESYIGMQLQLAGYEGFEDFEQFFIDQQKSSKMITDYIKSHPELFETIAKEGEARAISHILVKCADPNNPSEAEKKKMEDVEKALKEGTKFSKVANKYSDDTASAVTGGSIGISLKSDSLVEEFKNAAWKLKEGETSEWVKTEFGYHLIHIDSTSVKDMMKKDKYADSLRTIVLNKNPNLTAQIVWDKAKEIGLEIKDEETKKELMAYMKVKDDAKEEKKEKE